MSEQNNSQPAVVNLLNNLPSKLLDEKFECLHQASGIEIERIISLGHATPEGEWYDQSWDEWILVLSGAATLSFKTDQPVTQLVVGDSMMIPAHCLHRVEWTDPKVYTIWLAIHLGKP